ncbi:hypothetical protein LB503_011845 [Fusarium chuoi]|nr:hypothetical protein LB503_011845 [Fusarium chuoi]
MEAAEKQSDLKMPVEQELDHNSGEMNDITEVEKKVLSKFDKFVMPQMALLVLFAYLDRTNIGNARVFGFEEDTGMHGTQFNDVSMYFYISYVVFETPWVLAVKKFGPGRVLAIAIISWSFITLGTGFSSPVEYSSVSSRLVSFLLSLSSSLRSTHLRRKENAWRFFTSLLRSLEPLVDLLHMVFSPWVRDMVCLLGDGFSSLRVLSHSSSEPFAG